MVLTTSTGAIFGTGTNGAYVEDVAKVTKLKNSLAAALGGQMIINTEWGAFNNTVCVYYPRGAKGFEHRPYPLTQRSHLPTTPFDNKLDRESINPRFQAFEKFISGMYLGEITRNVLLALIDAAPKPILFGGKATNAINKHYGLDSAVMSDIEGAWGASKESEDTTTGKSLSSPEWESSLSAAVRDRLQRVRGVIIEKLGFAAADVSLRDAAIVRRVVTMVAERAAKLSGCAVAATLVQTERAVLGGGPPPPPRKGEETKIGVGVDGRLASLLTSHRWVN